jgi:hypothetical protein
MARVLALQQSDKVEMFIWRARMLGFDTIDFSTSNITYNLTTYHVLIGVTGIYTVSAQITVLASLNTTAPIAAMVVVSGVPRIVVQRAEQFLQGSTYSYLVHKDLFLTAGQFVWLNTVIPSTFGVIGDAVGSQTFLTLTRIA